MDPIVKVHLHHYRPKALVWWLTKLLRVGQAQGPELVHCEIDLKADSVNMSEILLQDLVELDLIKPWGWAQDPSLHAFQNSFQLGGRKGKVRDVDIHERTFTVVKGKRSEIERLVRELEGL